MTLQGSKPRRVHWPLQAEDRLKAQGSRPVGVQRSEAETVALEQLLRPAGAEAEADREPAL